MPGHIHHIEWCVSELEELSDQLISQFGFKLISGRETETSESPNCFVVRQRVLKSGYTVFILTEKKPKSQQSNAGTRPNSVGQKCQYKSVLKNHFKRIFQLKIVKSESPPKGH